MAQTTGIEWTDSTWNPVTGCTRVSAGCDNCYALTLAHRLLGDHYRRRVPANDTVENRLDPFAVRLWADRVEEPLRWHGPRMVFVNSMGDLFHRDVPEEFIRAVFDVMLRADHHVYQVLTKRPARMLRFLTRNRDLFAGNIAPPHIWLGTSIENQLVAYRATHLRKVPAEVRFLSCEPLLGPIEVDLTGIHWVIAGGESGAVHRPMCLEWARLIRDQCVMRGVPFFFKQVGGRTPKAGGRQLDGRIWGDFPPAATTAHR
jgi:protein gp37